jgi:hypothetical protein
MNDGPVPVPLMPAEVENLCSRGVAPDKIVRLLVATGAWSEAGAAEIVATLSDWSAHEPGPEPSPPGWPGPPEDPPPLFAA